MEIIIGENSGFCAGVKYTIQKSEEFAKEKKNIYCLGQLVHNERVIEDLEKKGIIFVQEIEEIPNNSIVIFRAHGETQDKYNKAKEKKLEIRDLTCGKIVAIRKKIEEYKEDYAIVILGKKDHPETIGTYSYAGDNANIIEEIEDIENVIKNISKNKIYIVSQTTFSSEKFDKIVDIIKENYKGTIIVNKTICNATEKRQEETKTLATQVNKMIIIGGKNSSNTKELYNISKKIQEKTFLIQDYHDLEREEFNKNDRVGIMAGASTPRIITEEVIKFLKEEKA